MNWNILRYVKSINKTQVPPLVQAPSLPPLDTSIDVDLPCIRCAYNLKSKLSGDRCSECGAAVLETFDKPRLAYASEEIIISTRRGIHLTTYGGIITGVFFLIGVCMDVLLVHSLFKSMLLASIAFLMIVGLVVHFVGAWIMATPHVYYKKCETIPRILIRLNILTLGTALALGTIFLIFKIMAGWASMSLQAVVILGCSIHGVVLSSLLLGIERRCADPRVEGLSRWKVLRAVLILFIAAYMTVLIEEIGRGKWERSNIVAGSTKGAVAGLTILGVVVLAIIARRTARIVDDEWRVSKFLSARRKNFAHRN